MLIQLNENQKVNKMKLSKDDKMVETHENRGHTQMKESGVKSDSRSVGIHVKDAKNGLSRATELCNEHNERGRHSPMVGGHKVY